MAVILETTTRRYIGSSADIKPVEEVGGEQIPAGSSFLEHDTGKIYRWTGTEWGWSSLAGDGLTEAAAWEVLQEIRQLRELTEAAIASEDPAVVEPFDTGLLTISTIGAGAAYASGDAMGGLTPFPVPTKGFITLTYAVDLDKEQLPFDLLVFRRMIAQTADNAAMDPSDHDALQFAGHMSVASFVALNDSAVATDVQDFPFEAPDGYLYVQAVTLGAPNYTTNRDLAIGLKGTR